jgi:PAS domain S-box-containing protein
VKKKAAISKSNKFFNDELLCEKLLTIVGSISDGVFTIDLDYKITFLNEAAERITGYSKNEALGKTCADILQTNICDESCALRKTIASKQPVINRLVCMTNKKGLRIPISISTAILKDKRGRIIGGVETFRDLNMAEKIRKEFEARFLFENILSQDHKMLELFKILPTLAKSGSPVLIEGESGTGKELVAHAIHNLSSRQSGPFVGVNCGALPDSLLESELFGYKAGAFTDAKKDKKGRFAVADNGTLFLDEIGDISPAMQVKLLRVLDKKTYEPLGSTQSLKANVRIVAATNKLLEQLTSQGEFRQDLYYRINVVKLTIPPLRERKGDIPLLADHFIDQFNKLQNKDISGISQPALTLLMKHNFPGNIRELENIIEHAFILSPGGVIKPENLPEYIQGQKPIPVIEIASTMKDMESLFIMGALKRNNWSRKLTAKELGINTSTLYRKIKKLGLKIPDNN